jgi:AcrR family transcriptional regulator
VTNRARILEAARQVFGAGGASASTEAVARRAGVGIATVFRHFPTKADLLDAVLADRFARLCERAGQLAATAEPGPALTELITEMVSDAPGKIALAEALTAAGGDEDGAAGRASARLQEAVGGLLERAQRAGAVRADIGLPELYALIVGMSRATAHVPLDPDTRARALGVLFDGLAPR